MVSKNQAVQISFQIYKDYKHCNQNKKKMFLKYDKFDKNKLERILSIYDTCIQDVKIFEDMIKNLGAKTKKLNLKEFQKYMSSDLGKYNDGKNI